MEPDSHEEKTEGELFQSQAINVDFESEKEAEELGIDSVLDTDESLLVDDVYKLDISVFIAETETPEADDETNSGLKKVTSTPKLYQALLPIYQTFCRKKNQDTLLKVFYGLIPQSCELLNCNDFQVANLIMIQLPDFLVGHYNTVIQHQKHGESSTGITCDKPSELNSAECGPLAYIGGYIISKLTQINKKRGNINEQIQALLQTGPANSFIANRTRGGLTLPSGDLINILEAAELAFRDEINRSEEIIRNIPTDTIYNAVVENPKVKSLWENIVMSRSLALDQNAVDGFVEAIKSRIIEENLYAQETNSGLKKVTSMPKLYQALLPIYQTFCRKKNQDTLLKVFYGLIPQSCELLNCNDFQVANLIMIQLPDFLVGHYNTVIQHQKHGESSTGITCDKPSELNSAECGPLAYIGGYIISKLTQINKKRGNINEQIQALLQTGPANSFIANRTRGGLTLPSGDLINILEAAELAFRDEINRSEEIIRNIPTDTIYNAVVENPKVKSLWENIVMSRSIQPSSTTPKLCLENVLKLFLKVQSFSYAKDYISKYQIKEKQGKNKALRNELKRKT
ncbi:Hypothetical predicted protein [Paramuricea clavata]|uniref:Uncharacterized protein n=2 Tax=Paramuricea clavata TaxID=317549 RepID=A0A6S7G0I5_PARCT|nr:Hypothetical predicted protein [Paramuricea clavata]